MKKLCAYFLAVAMLLGLILPMQSVKAAETKTAVALNLTPAVDGDISEWTDDAHYALSQRVVDGEAATTGWFMIRWDGNAIYVAGQITDATQEDWNDQIKFLFSFDGVPVGETAMDFSYVPKGGVYSWTAIGTNANGGNSLNMVNWNPENAYNNLQNAGAAIMGDGVNYSLFYNTYSNGVYTFESSWYPTDELKTFLTAGREIGFDLRWNDFNNGTSPSDSKLTTIGWASDDADWNSDLRKIGAVLLKGEETPEPKVAEANKGTAVLDGNLSEWIGEKYYLENRVVDGAAQTTGYFQIMWDDEYLYMGGEIDDATNQSGFDFLKVLFDLDGVPAGNEVITFADRQNAGVHTVSATGYNPNGGSNAWNPLNAWNGYLNPGNNVVAGVDSVITYVADSGKHVFEIKWYPTDAMKAKLVAGASLGLDVQWSDYNNGSWSDDPAITNIGWASGLVDWNNDLRTVGELRLVAPPVVVEQKKADAAFGTPVMDGNISEWTGEKYYMENRVVDGTAQTTGYFQAMWDNDYLYFAGEIADATKEDGCDILKIMLDIDGLPVGDAVVTFADRLNAGVHSASSTGYNPNGGANAWNPLNAWNGYLNPGSNVIAGCDAYIVFVEAEGKYNFEVKWYPTDALKAKLVAGSSFGFDIQWTDYNNGTYADDSAITNIGWASELVDWNNDLRTVGELTLAAVPAQMKGWNLALGDNIGVNFYVQLDTQDVENAYVNLVIDGETTVMPAAQAQKNDAGLYVFTAEMAAAQMMDSIEMALVVNGETLHADTYTICMYAEYILGSDDFNATTKALVKEMLNYGAAAQTYFDYNTENMPAVPQDVGAQNVPAQEQTQMVVEGAVNGIELYGTTLLFRNKTAVRFYFTVSRQIEDYTITYNGIEQKNDEKDGKWYVEIANINPQDLDQAITITVTCGGETLTVTYGPMNYMVRMSQKGTDNLKALLKAMYNYYLAAEAYVA